MSYSMEISGLQGSGKWTGIVGKEDWDQIKDLSRRQNLVSPFAALWYPVRTHTVKAFSEDLFFPTCFHVAMKANNIALQIAETLLFGFVDLCTFPIRVVTCLPSAVYNSFSAEHPLREHLRVMGVEEVFLNTDVVQIRFGKDPQWTTVAFVKSPEC